MAKAIPPPIYAEGQGNGSNPGASLIRKGGRVHKVHTRSLFAGGGGAGFLFLKEFTEIFNL